ncbi:hypothetical protein GCM10009573_05300 [Agromyces bracchium]
MAPIAPEMMIITPANQPQPTQPVTFVSDMARPLPARPSMGALTRIVLRSAAAATGLSARQRPSGSRTSSIEPCTMPAHSYAARR